MKEWSDDNDLDVCKDLIDSILEDYYSSSEWVTDKTDKIRQKLYEEAQLAVLVGAYDVEPNTIVANLSLMNKVWKEIVRVINESIDEDSHGLLKEDTFKWFVQNKNLQLSSEWEEWEKKKPKNTPKRKD